MTAEWPRGKVVNVAVEGEMFEANGRRHLLHGDCKEFSWDDGTIQTVQSIEKNVVSWTTSHPNPAWQQLRWICTPQCEQAGCHDMTLANEGAYRCATCASSGIGKHWHCNEHDIHLCPNCSELPPEAPTLGVAAKYLVEQFSTLAIRATGKESPNFYEICPVLACGLGYQKTCPRDGLPHCSIVDALDDDCSGRVTHFISWCWRYTLKDFVSAVNGWLKKTGADPALSFLWVCFFCNNQYRIIQEATQTGSHELKSVFESHLAKAGRMLVLLDSIVSPAYITRAWCIFESYVCIEQNIPMTIILPSSAETFFMDAVARGQIDTLNRALDALDVRDAKASQRADEDLIKRLILTSIGFDAVNQAVRSRLEDQLTTLFRQMLTRQRPR
ncbi:Caln1, partial [Symbiodinium pilosum]